MAAALKKNPRFIAEPAYTKRLDDMAERIVRQYAVGRLIVAGDNRYLSGDLLDFLVTLLDHKQIRTKRERSFFASALTDVRHFPQGAVYAPGAVYPWQEVCTLLRNPHIARNEEIQLSFFDDRDNMRQFYFHQLTDVVMVESNMLAARITTATWSRPSPTRSSTPACGATTISPGLRNINRWRTGRTSPC